MSDIIDRFQACVDSSAIDNIDNVKPIEYTPGHLKTWWLDKQHSFCMITAFCANIFIMFHDGCAIDSIYNALVCPSRIKKKPFSDSRQGRS